jgi:hypothetical protein
MKPDIELHIEELVLHGFRPADRYRIVAAVERELARFFSEQDIPPALLVGGASAHIDAGAFQLQPGAKPDAIGEQLARSLYKGLGAASMNHQRPLAQRPSWREVSGSGAQASKGGVRGQ